MHAFIFHFEPLWTSFWINFRSLLAPLGLHFGLPGGLLGAEPQNVNEKPGFWSQLGDHFGSIFQWYFGSFFETFFESFLESFWTHSGSQDGAKINKKSVQNSIEFLFVFLFGSWSVFPGFWQRFGYHEPSKMSVSCRRGAIFQKTTFFRTDAAVDRFCIDFWRFWEPFWGPFWNQNRIRKSIKKSIWFWIDSGLHFGSTLASFSPQFWLPKFDTKFIDFRRSSADLSAPIPPLNA